MRQAGRIQATQIRRKLLRQRQSKPESIDDGGDALHPGSATVQSFGQQVGQQQHLDAAGSEQLGERIVFLLRPCDPGQSVE